MIQLRCPLGHVLEIGTEHLGQRLMCPLCQAVVHAMLPRPGEPPTAKYEVQCAKGHILRVKQKYLGKEVRCPSCQMLVSMKAQNLLTSDGTTLAVAQPGAFHRQPPAIKPEPPAKKPTRAPAPTAKNKSLTPRIPSSRIPPPPKANDGSGTDDPPALAPELVEEDGSHPQPAVKASMSAATISDNDFEFEVVDTQFHMELEASGMEAPKAAPVKKAPRPNKPEPPQQLPLVRRPLPVSLPPPPPAKAPSSHHPTGLHSLSGSEIIQIKGAALHQQQPAPVATQFECPHGHLLEVEEQYRGMQIQCPICKVIFELSK